VQVNPSPYRALGPAVLLLLHACASSSGNDPVGAAGGAGSGAAGGSAAGGASSANSSASGGSVAAGSSGSTGGSGVTASGGAHASGGMPTLTGGATGQGGSPSTGGSSAGGTAAGNGGSSGASGSIGSGGASGSGGNGGAAGSGGMGGSIGATSGPCDIYALGNTPCVAAHSTVRALYGAYSGNLYQVRRASDSTKKDIAASTAGGAADSGTQDSFCSGTTCVVTVIYDQSGRGNHLEYQGQGSSVGGQDKPANANSESLTVSGHKVYSMYINPGNSYWRDGHTTGIPTGAAPEGLYMVTSGTHVNGGCCFDYGNSETTRSADGAGAMDAIYFGTSCWFGGCSGTGPWVQADLEYGLFPGGSQSWNPKQVAFTHKFVTALLKNNGTTKFALKGGNGQSGSLTTLWDGALPGGYNPMKKQGAIVLGSGGDCCARNTNQSLGTFYEGAIASGYPTDATDSALQENIVAAGYK
jgi:hypothetical protein